MKCCKWRNTCTNFLVIFKYVFSFSIYVLCTIWIHNFNIPPSQKNIGELCMLLSAIMTVIPLWKAYYLCKNNYCLWIGSLLQAAFKKKKMTECMGGSMSHMLHCLKSDVPFLEVPWSPGRWAACLRSCSRGNRLLHVHTESPFPF